jgi:Family of unknown function (DUF6459)
MPSRTLPPGLRPAPEPLAPPALLQAGQEVTSADLPGLRLVIVPDTAPPYDCEAHGTACPAQRDPAGAETVSPRGAGWAPEPVSPHTAAWPRQFAQVVVEILAGARSPRQIVPCSTDRVRAQIALLTPLVAADRPPRIQRIVMSHPAAHAVEMTVVVSFGPRARALAIRCEQLPPRPAAPGRPGRPARWLCTELEAG